MKLLIPLLFVIISNTKTIAQVINISFEHYEMEYPSLAGASHLTENFSIDDWEYENILLDLEVPIYMESNEGGLEYYIANISTSGFVDLNGANLTTFDFADLRLVPLDLIMSNTYNAELIDNHTEIYYLFQDSISYIEFKNITFSYDEFLEISPEARFNVIVAIDHRDGNIKYFYGPSNYPANILEDFDEELWVGINLFYERQNSNSQTLGILENDPTNPDLQIIIDPIATDWNGMFDYPSENSVYSFTIGNMTSQTFKDLDFQVGIFPNPGSDNINIQIEDIYSTGKINIYNSIGQVVLADLPFNSQFIATKDWTPGLYTIILSTSEGYQTIKWMKI